MKKINSGIYLIKNIINGHFYIGMSVNLKRRSLEHFCNKSISQKPNVIYKAIRKYGKENFVFEVLEYINNCETLSEREVFWIEKLKPNYNMNLGGLGNKAFRVSEITKSILSEKSKKQWDSLSEIEKQNRISKNLKGPEIGHEVSLQTREKLRLVNLGKKQSSETRLKRSDSQKVSMKGNSNGNKIILGVSETMGLISFNSCVSAGEYFNKHPSSITKSLKGKRKQAFGYKWEYLN